MLGLVGIEEVAHIILEMIFSMGSKEQSGSRGGGLKRTAKTKDVRSFGSSQSAGTETGMPDVELAVERRRSSRHLS